MKRREFLKSSVAAASAGASLSARTDTGYAAAASTGGSAPPAILKTYTAGDHRRRLANISICTQKIRRCMRSHLITDYLPGQCVYNMGEYPSRERWKPEPCDEEELDRLKTNGIQLVHVMDEWNDRYGMFGGNKLTAVNPTGFSRFVSMVHQRGMKILAYASTGYFVGSDPDYRKEWSRPGDALSGWWDLTRCSPASPGWRAYLLPRMLQILEDYEVDGLYNDWGYVSNKEKRIKEPANDEMAAFEETPQYDGAVTDLLYLVYSEMKRRGLIYKMHADRSNQPQTRGLKVYDYLWVGEGVSNADGLGEAVKNHDPYLVPCIDMFAAKVEDDNIHFLYSIPYMQFPLLQGGRPFTGERSVIPIPRLPGVTGTGRYSAAWKYYQAHPNGPYLYGGWDRIPPSTGFRSAHARWLKQYRTITEDGTWAYLEVSESDLLARPLPARCVASAFANRDLYFVLANHGQSPEEIELTDPYVALDDPASAPAKVWRLPPRSLRIIKRSV